MRSGRELEPFNAPMVDDRLIKCTIGGRVEFPRQMMKLKGHREANLGKSALCPNFLGKCVISYHNVS